MSARQWKQLWVGTRATLGRLQRRLEGWRAARRALRELELGRTPDGGTVVLDYQSGRLLARRPARTTAAWEQVVPFEHADLVWLERVIAMAGYRVALDDDGDLEVRTEAGPVYVRRTVEAAIVCFFMRVVDDATTLSDNRFELVNVINQHTTQGRWVLNDEDALFMSCDLYAGAGLTSAHVLNTLRAVTHEVAVVTAHLDLDRDAA